MWRGPAPLPSERPRDPVATRDPGHRLPEIPLQHRPPRDERELAWFLDERETPAGEIEPASVNAFDPLARPDLGIVQAEFAGKLAGDPCQLPPLQHRQHVPAIGDPILILAGELLFDEPLPAPRKGVANLPTKTRVA